MNVFSIHRILIQYIHLLIQCIWRCFLLQFESDGHWHDLGPDYPALTHNLTHYTVTVRVPAFRKYALYDQIIRVRPGSTKVPVDGGDGNEDVSTTTETPNVVDEEGENGNSTDRPNGSKDGDDGLEDDLNGNFNTTAIDISGNSTTEDPNSIGDTDEPSSRGKPAVNLTFLPMAALSVVLLIATSNIFSA